MGHDAKYWLADPLPARRESKWRIRAAALSSVALAAFLGSTGSGSAQTACPVQNSSCYYNSVQPTAGHGGVGPTGATTNLLGDQSYTASAYSPVFIYVQGGNGGDANDDSGENGGAGGAGGAITFTLTPAGSATTSTVSPFDFSAVYVADQGGAGGGAESSDAFGHTNEYSGGTGGNGGAVTIVDLGGQVVSDTSALGAIISSNGGAGGTGADSGSGSYAAAGGDGGSGGTATVAVSSAVSSTGNTGLQVSANGGAGYDGGSDNGGFSAQGATGGSGGAAGSVGFTLDNTGAVSGSNDPAILLQANGGLGGTGGHGASGVDNGGGDGGAGSTGGQITATLDGTVTATNGPGIEADAFGGDGGDGGDAETTVIAGGGNGGTSGPGGDITINGSGGIITTVATNASVSSLPGVVAQSVGGGGGTGSDTHGFVYSHGGHGAGGGNGGNVTLSLADTISTQNDLSPGLEALSVGGGGGSAGYAEGTDVVVPFAVVVGGVAGNGGDGQTVLGGNLAGGTISTSGADSSGMRFESIGGGGGIGGAAYSTDYAGALSIAIAIGGNGGKGGSGGNVGISNTGDAPILNAGLITTTGTDSFGMQAESIGGGGGAGGASVAKAISLIGVEIDDVSVQAAVSVAVGGSGGSGGSGGNVDAQNAGSIFTAGSGATGMLVQSIGGGGGNGGDSSAISTLLADNGGTGEDGLAIVLGGSVAVAGSGAAGGNGEQVTAANTNGLIVTTGEGAAGILAQSVGGGGGVGGLGDASNQIIGSNDGGDDDDSEDEAESLSIGGGIGAGGGGGNGGSGSTVNVSNAGGILTMGDGAAGIMAQSIGGSGGAGNGGAVSGNNFAIAVNVAVGGDGGSGNEGGDVNVTNTGNIVTYGADSSGILATSIGGGGGSGGKTGTTAGTAGSSSNGAGGNGDLAKGVASYGGSITDLLNAAYGLVGQSGSADGSDIGDDLESLSGDSGDGDDDSEALSLSLAVNVGGTGGAGGDGQTVTATNNGGIATVGVMSDGIVAQSIGGGGGNGGATATSAASKADLSINLGGDGNAAGDGGNVTVTENGGITTVGNSADGILAQSIGGGGGVAGAEGNTIGILQNGNAVLTLGGANGAAGSGGTININDQSGEISTAGYGAIGIAAQDIGGGGGDVTTLPSGTPDQKDAETYLVSFTFGNGGLTGAAGDGGPLNSASNNPAVYININPNTAISTTGRDAYGVLAQSIGGGGGLETGGSLASDSVFGKAVDQGEGEAVDVYNFGNIVTTGAGAIGVLAQSVGGGGGVAGDTGSNAAYAAPVSSLAGSGDGGAVTVSVPPNAVVETSGAAAPAIFAQSVGGGGGLITTTSATYAGSSGGGGAGGGVTVYANGTIAATGAGSAGIFAQSAGGPGQISAPILVSVGTNGTVEGGSQITPGDDSAPGIRIDGGNAISSNFADDTIQNAGTITSVAGTSGVAIYSTNADTTINNTGNIYGTIDTNGGGGTGTVNNTGNIYAGPALDLAGGTLTNAGNIFIGTVGSTSKTKLTGNLLQQPSGELIVDVDSVHQAADELVVTGNATLAGRILVNPISINQSTVTVVKAASITAAPAQATLLSGSTLITYDADVTGDPTLQLTANAHFDRYNALLDRPQRHVANYLQHIWKADKNGSLSPLYVRLANTVTNANLYASALNSLSGEAASAVGALQPEESLRFVDANSACAQAGPSADTLKNCGWGRFAVDGTSLAGSSVATGFNQTQTSLQLGFQHEVAPNWFVGSAVEYNWIALNGSNGTGYVTGNSGAADIFLNHTIGHWIFGLAADGGSGGYSSTRDVVLSQTNTKAYGSPSTAYAGLHTRIAYEMPFSIFYLKPYLDLAGIYARTGAYTESGAGALDLQVQSAGATRFAASPMLESGATFPAGYGRSLNIYAAVGGLFLNNNSWSAAAALTGAPLSAGTFKSSTSLPSQFAQLTLGADLTTIQNITLRLEYNGTYGGPYTANTASLKVQGKF